MNAHETGGGVNARQAAQAELERSRSDLDRLFRPKRGVAIVGRVDASPAALAWLKRFGEDVRFVFVNPKGGEANGVPVVRSIAELPDYVDLVVVKVGPPTVAGIVADCGRRGIRDVVVFSTGFSEIGAEGAALEAEVALAARTHNVRVIGPNTNDNTFEQFPLPANHRGGLIALITQSGFNGRPLVEGVSMGAGFRRWVTVGNEVDLEVADFIHYYAHDAETSVIAAYVEGFKSIDKLRAALEAANRMDKPVVMLKIGATERGAKMAASHTGHLAGANAAVEGLFRQHGVTRVRDLDELLETANLFSKLPPRTGRGCALYSVSGGSTTLMAELADSYQVPIPPLQEKTVEALYTHLPSYVAVSNPVDNGGVFVMASDQPKRLEVLDLIAADPGVDTIVVGLTAALGILSDRFAADVLAWAPTGAKPVVAVWGSVVTDGPGYKALVESGVPIFRSFRKCFRALRAFARYQQARISFRIREFPKARVSAAQRSALSRPGVVDTQQAAVLLREAGVALVQDAIVNDAEAARAAADRIGYPLVMKLASADFPHKSDVGLVTLGVTDGDAAVATFKELVAKAKALKPSATVDGVQIQRQIEAGVEMIVGVSSDPQFGHLLTIGAGGIYAEILADAATRPLPVDRDDIREMIGGLRVAALLAGARGKAPADVEALVEMAMNVAALSAAAGGQLAELDLNPVIVSPRGAVAVDALVIAG